MNEVAANRDRAEDALCPRIVSGSNPTEQRHNRSMPSPGHSLAPCGSSSGTVVRANGGAADHGAATTHRVVATSGIAECHGVPPNPTDRRSPMGRRMPQRTWAMVRWDCCLFCAIHAVIPEIRVSAARISVRNRRWGSPMAGTQFDQPMLARKWAPKARIPTEVCSSRPDVGPEANFGGPDLTNRLRGESIGPEP